MKIMISRDITKRHYVVSMDDLEEKS